MSGTSDLGDSELVFYASDNTATNVVITATDGNLVFGSDSGSVNIQGVGSITSSGGTVLTETGGGVDTITLSAPSVVPSSYSILFPGAQGGANTTLENDGSGNLSWTTPSTENYSFTDVTTSTYTTLFTDNVIGVSYTATGACVITLPLISGLGKIMYIITDTGGNANENNITVNCNAADTIMGGSNVIVSENYNSVSIFNDNVNGWYIF